MGSTPIRSKLASRLLPRSANWKLRNQAKIYNIGEGTIDIEQYNGIMGNMRYCKQRNDFECAPIAILNALKWSGVRVTLNDVAEIRKVCKTNRHGTYSKYFRRELKKRGSGYFDITHFEDKMPNDKWFLDKLWDNRYAMIVGHEDVDWPEDCHFSLWIGRTEYYVKTVNYDSRATERKLRISNIPVFEEVYLLEK